MKAEAAQAVTAALQSRCGRERRLLSDGGESRGCALGSSGPSVSKKGCLQLMNVSRVAVRRVAVSERPVRGPVLFLSCRV